MLVRISKNKMIKSVPGPIQGWEIQKKLVRFVTRESYKWDNDVARDSVQTYRIIIEKTKGRNSVLEETPDCVPWDTVSGRACHNALQPGPRQHDMKPDHYAMHAP